jgi:hypothetical protein
LELGAGIGTMASRLVEWRVLHEADYTLLDVSPELLDAAREHLTAWGSAQGAKAENRDGALVLWTPDMHLSLRFEVARVESFLASGSGLAGADLFVANAFLDLVDVPTILPRLFELASPNACYWFSINFDGETVFVPEHASDQKLLRVYHESMDQRVRNGRPSGDSKTGRHLFEHLERAGASVLAAGASDWVVHPLAGRYEADEAYFLHYLVHTIQSELAKHAEIAAEELAAWAELRRAQIDRSELRLVAHQLDFFGRVRAER